MNRVTGMAVLLALGMALAAGAALAEKGGHGKGHGNPHDAGGGPPWSGQDEDNGPPGKENKPGKGAMRLAVHRWSSPPATVR